MERRIRAPMVVTASLASGLREILAADRVLDDPTTLLPYSYDASFWSLRKRRMPEVVVIPETTAEVAEVVRFADRTGTPIVARGAGTGQTGGAGTIQRTGRFGKLSAANTGIAPITIATSSIPGMLRL